MLPLLLAAASHIKQDAEEWHCCGGLTQDDGPRDVTASALQPDIKDGDGAELELLVPQPPVQLPDIHQALLR